MTDQTVFIFIVVSTFIMVALAVGVLIVFNSSQQRTLNNLNEIHEQKLAFQEKLLASNIKIQEQERSRIAKELHDDIGSKLNIINLNLHLLQSTIPKNDYTNEILQGITTSLTNSINRTRQMAHELLPPILTKFGLASAIKSLADEVSRTKTIKFSLENADALSHLDSTQELHVYRIIQELINNTIKHAKASAIDLKVATEGNDITLTYIDDGIGAKSPQKLSTGLGMDNINTRIQLLKGAVQYETALGNGLRAQMTFPTNK